eukprot:5706088-Pyramimonas_sp.AAC.1
MIDVSRIGRGAVTHRMTWSLTRCEMLAWYAASTPDTSASLRVARSASEVVHSASRSPRSTSPSLSYPGAWRGLGGGQDKVRRGSGGGQEGVRSISPSL